MYLISDARGSFPSFFIALLIDSLHLSSGERWIEWLVTLSFRRWLLHRAPPPAPSTLRHPPSLPGVPLIIVFPSRQARTDNKIQISDRVSTRYTFVIKSTSPDHSLWGANCRRVDGLSSFIFHLSSRQFGAFASYELGGVRCAICNRNSILCTQFFLLRLFRINT